MEKKVDKESKPIKAIKKWVGKYGISYLFMLPYGVLFIVFIIIPVITSIGLSFTYFNVLEPPRWIGWTNYKLLFLEDEVWLIAIKNTFVFALITGPGSMIASFVFAWLINRLRYRTAWTLAFYAPSIVSGIAMSIVWMYILSGDRYGLLNHYLMELGILNEPFLWLENVRSMLPSVMIVTLWMSMGTGFLVFLAGLQNVPQVLYEVGKVDGIENRFQEVWYITLPLIKPQLLFGAVMAIVNSFAVFDIAMQLTGFPSPQYATHTIVGHLYDYGFVRFEMGYASAIAVVLFGLTFGLSRIMMRIFSTHGAY